MTSVLVPWNTCGAYISGVLGVPTVSYLPFCFFNILSPILDVLFGFIGFKVPTIAAVEAASDAPATRATGRPSQRLDRRSTVSDQTTDGSPPRSATKKRGSSSPPPTRSCSPDRARRARHVVRPGRHVRPEQGRRADPRHLPRGGVAPAAILVDSLKAPINGLYGIEDKKGNINYYNTGTLFGAIDVALFILVIGGFLGVTMKTGAIQAGIATARPTAPRQGAVDDPAPDDGVRDRWHDLRDGGGEPRLLRAGHHRDDRRRVRRAHRRRDRAARMRDRDRSDRRSTRSRPASRPGSPASRSATGSWDGSSS